MFQTFEASSGPEHVAERLKALRGWLAKSKIDAFLVPRADEHQGEYVPPAAERLRWLTGFTGSPRATLNVTVAGPNKQIQGLYQIVNPTSGSISNHVMVRPGSN